MNKRFLGLPRGYISYSQIVLWQNDPQRYKEIYFDNREELRTSNAGMEFGKKVAMAMEHAEETGDLLTDAAMLLLPKYDIRDQEIVVDMKTKNGWIKILGRPDMLDSKTKNFREIKTGKTAWTQKKVQSHLQLKFYAMLIYLQHKKVLHDAWLDWVETEQTADGIQPTGRVESFRVTFTLNDILETMALTSRVAKEIELSFISHVPNPALAW